MLPHPSNHVWAQHCQGFTLGSSNTLGDICNTLVHCLHVPHLSQPYLRAVLESRTQLLGVELHQPALQLRCIAWQVMHGKHFHCRCSGDCSAALPTESALSRGAGGSPCWT